MMSNITLSNHAVKILKIIKYRTTSINDLARDLDKSSISDDIGGYMVYLYQNGYIRKYMSFDDSESLSLSDKTTLTVKGTEYLRSLNQEKWAFIRKSIVTPIFVTIITFILCKHLEKYF